MAADFMKREAMVNAFWSYIEGRLSFMPSYIMKKAIEETNRANPFAIKKLKRDMLEEGGEILNYIRQDMHVGLAEDSLLKLYGQKFANAPKNFIFQCGELDTIECAIDYINKNKAFFEELSQESIEICKKYNTFQQQGLKRRKIADEKSKKGNVTFDQNVENDSELKQNIDDVSEKVTNALHDLNKLPHFERKFSLKNIKVSVQLNKNFTYEANISCPEESCGKELTIQKTRNGYWMIGNFKRHIISLHSTKDVQESEDDDIDARKERKQTHKIRLQKKKGTVRRKAKETVALSREYSSDSQTSSQSTEQQSVENDLQVCKENSNVNCEKNHVCLCGKETSGAHLFVKCNKFVHVICSSPLNSDSNNSDNEGFGQKRMCNICKRQNPVATDVSNANEEKTLVDEASKNKYVTTEGTKRTSTQVIEVDINDCSEITEVGDFNNFVVHRTNSTENITYPIINNGNNCEPITIGNEKISIKNTCCFDSIFHLLLIAASGYEQIKNKLRSLDENFFKMVQDTIMNGLQISTYQLRTNALADIFTARTVSMSDDNRILDCAVQAGWLTQKLFKNWPSLTEVSKCETCNYRNEKNLTAIQIEDFELKASESENFIETFCSTCNSRCYNCFPESCTEPMLLTVKTDLSNIGDIVSFDIFNKNEQPIKFKLSTFHTKIRNPLSSDKELVLIGILRYIHFARSTRPKRNVVNADNISEGPHGHYTTIAYRNNSWIEMDDLKTCQMKRAATFQVIPRLLLYVNVKK